MKKQIDVEKLKRIVSRFQCISKPELKILFDNALNESEIEEPEIPIVVGGVYEIDRKQYYLHEDLEHPLFNLFENEEFGYFSTKAQELTKDEVRIFLHNNNAKYLGKAEIRVREDKKDCCEKYMEEPLVIDDHFETYKIKPDFCPECGAKL